MMLLAVIPPVPPLSIQLPFPATTGIVNLFNAYPLYMIGPAVAAAAISSKVEDLV